MLLIAQMTGQLRMQAGLQHPLHQLRQKPALPGQLHPAFINPVHQLIQEPLVEELINRLLRRPLRTVSPRHNVHPVPRFLRSVYTDNLIPPHTVAVFDNAWERFTPFLAFPPMLRRVIYTTNSIESLNYQLRKIIKNRGHFPNDDAVIKLLWLAICSIEDKRARDRAKEAGLSRSAKRKADGRLVEGQTTTSWKQAL